MKFYRDDQGSFYRTQAQAKANKRPFDPAGIDVPTDSQGLCNFLNAILPPLDQPIIVDTMSDIEAEVFQNVLAKYQNGDQIGTYLGSRDPDAIYTCCSCGANNRPKRSSPHVARVVVNISDPESDDDSHVMSQ